MHPFDPLSPEEVSSAVSVLRKEKKLPSSFKFVTIDLQEPSKKTVFQWKKGDRVERRAFLTLLNRSNHGCYEAVVSITSKKVISFVLIPGAHAALFPDEYQQVEKLVKESPEFIEAMRKRGVTDMDLVMIDVWSSGNGYVGENEDYTRRICKPLVFARPRKEMNGYAHPVDSVTPIVDLGLMKVIRIDDTGVIPIPTTSGDFFVEPATSSVQDLKPLQIIQPEGSSLRLEGHELSWANWNMHVGFNCREGLVLHKIGFFDEARKVLRPIIWRASISEMVVPYGDPRSPHYRKNAFDAGEEGLGFNANSLQKGCDCLGEIFYLDVNLTDSEGKSHTIKNGICIHEEDYGVLWKHTDWRTGESRVKRSRRLVVSFFVTVANYDYGFFWYFYLDGTIQVEIKLTGILNVGTLPYTTGSHQEWKYGAKMTPELVAPIHQHFFNVRFEMSLDGFKNRLYEVNAEACKDPINKQQNSFFAVSTLVETEKQSVSNVSAATGRYWRIANQQSTNWLGQPVAYRVVPGENTLPFATPNSSIAKRASFLMNQFYATPSHPEERYPAGKYPNQHIGGDGLPKWIEENRSIVDQDLVVWYNMGVLHDPRLEEWPIMPVSYLSMSLKPDGFFDYNPSANLDPSLVDEINKTRSLKSKL